MFSNQINERISFLNNMNENKKINNPISKKSFFIGIILLPTKLNVESLIPCLIPKN